MSAGGYLDACGFNPTSGGTATWTVSAAITGYQTPASAGAINAMVYSYRAESNDKTQWEEGSGAYTVSGTTLARTTISANSSGGTSAINFTVAPNVFITALTVDLTNAALLTGTASININGTVGATTPANGSFTSLSASSSTVSPFLYGGTAAGSTLTINGTFNGTPSSAYVVVQSNLQPLGIGTTSPSAFVDISKNTATMPSAAGGGGSMLRVTSADGAGTVITMLAAASQNNFNFFRSEGTLASPTALAAGSVIGIFGFDGYNGSAYAAGLKAAVTGVALNTWSGTDNSTYLTFGTTPSGTVGRVEAVRIQASGGMSVGTTADPGIGMVLANAGVLAIGASGVGYGTGAGGTVTQATSRTTGVTLNKTSGAITLFTAAATVGAYGTFTVTNSTVAANDTISLSWTSSTNIYNAIVKAVAAGSFNVSVGSVSGTASDAPVLQFNVIKGVTS